MTRSASSVYWAGPKPMAPRNEAEAGQQARHALWKFAGKSRLRGVRRDQAAVRLIRNRYSAARAFTDTQLAAVLREPQGGLCSWDALKVLCAAGDEQMPTKTTPGLTALLGEPCARCLGWFAEQESVAFEHRVLAAGGRPVTRRVTGPQPTGMLWPAGQEPPGLTAAARAAARRKPDSPSYYQANRGRLPKE